MNGKALTGLQSLSGSNAIAAGVGGTSLVDSAGPVQINGVGGELINSAASAVGITATPNALALGNATAATSAGANAVAFAGTSKAAVSITQWLSVYIGANQFYIPIVPAATGPV